MFEDDENKRNHQRGIPLINCNHLMWNSPENFTVTHIYFDAEIKLDFYGIDLHKEFLRLKFVCFCEVEDDAIDVYINDLEVNDCLITKVRSVSKLNDGEFEEIYIDIPETSVTPLNKVKTISLKFVEILEKWEVKWTQQIQITCDVDLQVYSITTDECIVTDLSDEELVFD